MNKLKVVFTQALMISTGILFGIGVQSLTLHYLIGYEKMNWQWYIPLSIVLTGFLCSIPTLLISSMENFKKTAAFFCIVIHFVSVGGVVSFCGYIFRWFTCLDEYLPILIMYVIIYIFVWVTTIWMRKSDDKKINDAIKDFQDEE